MFRQELDNNCQLHILSPTLNQKQAKWFLGLQVMDLALEVPSLTASSNITGRSCSRYKSTISRVTKIVNHFYNVALCVFQRKLGYMSTVV